MLRPVPERLDLAGRDAQIAHCHGDGTDDVRNIQHPLGQARAGELHGRVDPDHFEGGRQQRDQEEAGERSGERVQNGFDLVALDELLQQVQRHVIVLAGRQRGAHAGDPDGAEDDDLLRRAEGVVEGIAAYGVDEAHADHQKEQRRAEPFDDRGQEIIDFAVDI